MSEIVKLFTIFCKFLFSNIHLKLNKCYYFTLNLMYLVYYIIIIKFNKKPYFDKQNELQYFYSQI